MASINMCDRCGAMGLASAIGTCIYHTGPNSATEKLELCPECIGELVAWVKSPPVRENRNAFREEWTETRELESGE